MVIPVLIGHILFKNNSIKTTMIHNICHIVILLPNNSLLIDTIYVLIITTIKVLTLI